MYPNGFWLQREELFFIICKKKPKFHRAFNTKEQQKVNWLHSFSLLYLFSLPFTSNALVTPISLLHRLEPSILQKTAGKYSSEVRDRLGICSSVVCCFFFPDHFISFSFSCLDSNLFICRSL